MRKLHVISRHNISAQGTTAATGDRDRHERRAHLHPAGRLSRHDVLPPVAANRTIVWKIPGSW